MEKLSLVHGSASYLRTMGYATLWEVVTTVFPTWSLRNSAQQS